MKLLFYIFTELSVADNIHADFGLPFDYVGYRTLQTFVIRRPIIGFVVLPSLMVDNQFRRSYEAADMCREDTILRSHVRTIHSHSRFFLRIRD